MLTPQSSTAADRDGQKDSQFHFNDKCKCNVAERIMGIHLFFLDDFSESGASHFLFLKGETDR